jgi:LmbE family N-acetylglucosaminyl deacetylase
MTATSTSAKRVFALCAHPDDIEFFMAGTLILLGRAGYEMHYMSIADGCCGSQVTGPAETAAIRLGEAKAAAKMIGAAFHPPLVHDMEILYDLPTLRRLAALMREVAPEILLIHPPADYMEDHTNACRLAVTAAFTREMPNFVSDPPRPIVDQPVTIYHSQPNGNRDPLGALVRPSQFVDITAVMDQKTAMLECHQSQGGWLATTQGHTSYITGMQALSREVGAMSGRYEYAEGWRRHLHLGFCSADADPLSRALGQRVLAAEPSGS